MSKEPNRITNLERRGDLTMLVSCFLLGSLSPLKMVAELGMDLLKSGKAVFGSRVH